MDGECARVLSGLTADGYLLGLARERLVERLALYYGEVNVVHPFREGNGRTLRAFLRQLAASAGYRLDWSALHPQENILACLSHAMTGDPSALVALLTPAVSGL